MTSPPNRWRPNSLDEHTRRVVRATVVGAIMMLAIAYMWAPRTVSSSESIWFSPRSTIGAAEFDYQRATHQGGRQGGNRSLLGIQEGWSVGGFPVDSYHVVKKGRNTRVAFNGIAMTVNLLANAILFAGGLFFTYVESPKETILTTLRPRDQMRSRVLIGLSAALGILVPIAVYHFRTCERLNRDAYQAREAGVIRSINHPFMSQMPTWFQSAWTHIHRLEVYAAVQNSTQTRSWSRTQQLGPIDFSAYPALQTVGIVGPLEDTDFSEVAERPLLHSLTFYRVKSVESVQKIIREAPLLDTLEIHMARRRSNRGPDAWDSLDDIEFYGRGWDYEMPDEQDLHDHSPGSDDDSEDTFDAEFVQGEFDLGHLHDLRVLQLGHVPESAIDLAQVIKTSPYLQELDWKIAGEMEDSFVISGMPILKTISLSSTRVRTEPTRMVLEDLPNLCSVYLPRSQEFDLTLSDLPLLTGFEARAFFSMDDDDGIDSMPFVHSLTIKNAPSLLSVDIATTELHRWQIDNCVSMRRLSVSKEQPSISWEEMRGGTYDPSDDKPTVKSLAPLWDWLSQRQGVNSLRLVNLNIRGVDFSRFQNLPYLKSVWLDGCNASIKQLEAVAKMPSMRELHAPNIQLSDKAIQRLLAANSQWETLKVDWSNLRKIEIRNQPLLRSATGNRELIADSIQLENLPRLRDHLFTRTGIHQLSLTNVGQLQGLFITGRIPRTANISGISALEHFCIATSDFRPEYLEVLKKCEDLQTLCLPNCVVPESLFEQFPKWDKLSTVDLKLLRIKKENGEIVPLSDEHVVSLAKIKKLSRINLDRTTISGRSIQLLAKCEDLQAISVRGCRLRSGDLDPLAGSRVLTELNVTARMKVPEQIQDIVVRGGPNDDPDDLSTFDMSWNSIFIGEPKVKERLRSRRAEALGPPPGGGGPRGPFSQR
ncbi:MAG: leucine-rich repeat domain-containing protein, partial [Rhodopirellula sp. JB044]|uniref:leucine-rich repeat domain-containing protein n=1 Tax=Rhodopirellula sp. JB044 TaxID=3342844 RepID=UPI00370CDED6